MPYISIFNVYLPTKTTFNNDELYIRVILNSTYEIKYIFVKIL